MDIMLAFFGVIFGLAARSASKDAGIEPNRMSIMLVWVCCSYIVAALVLSLFFGVTL